MDLSVRREIITKKLKPCGDPAGGDPPSPAEPENPRAPCEGGSPGGGGGGGGGLNISGGVHLTKLQDNKVHNKANGMDAAAANAQAPVGAPGPLDGLAAVLNN